MENPYAPSQVDHLFQPSESTIAKAWLGFFLLSGLAGFGAGAGLGAIIGFFMGSAGFDLPTIQITTGLVGFLAGIPISYLFFRRSVLKLFKAYAPR